MPSLSVMRQLIGAKLILEEHARAGAAQATTVPNPWNA
jgi:hypothetical protein